VIDGIEADPAWDGGEYKSEPQMGLRVAADLLMIAGGAPLHLQQDFPTRAAADKYEAAAVAKIIATTDANDTIYQVDASRNYNPAPALDRIVAPVMWINSGDDFINPPALAIAQVEAPKMKHARFVLLPESLETHGHGTHTWAAVWKDYLAELLKESGT
jgi:homoserine O-acetyltransferase